MLTLYQNKDLRITRSFYIFLLSFPKNPFEQRVEKTSCPRVGLGLPNLRPGATWAQNSFRMVYFCRRGAFLYRLLMDSKYDRFSLKFIKSTPNLLVRFNMSQQFIFLIAWVRFNVSQFVRLPPPFR